MKKKFAAAVIAAAMAGSLVGCSGELSNEYVTVKQYKGLEVPLVETTEVTDDMVEQTIQSNLSAAAERTEVTDRAAQTGDVVNIDYTGYLDGEAFEGGSAEGSDLELGSGSFIGATEDYAGFEDQIVGHQKGEEFDITVQFPDPYTNPDMAGKVADFHIVLNGIYTETVPELTDEWVQSNSTDSESVDEYREEIRGTLEDNYEASVESELGASVQSALLENLEIKSYPEDAVSEQVTQMTNYYTQIAGLYGMELSEFVESYLQTTEEDFNAQLEEGAQQSAAFDEAAKLIAEKENLEPSEEEYQEAMAEYAEEAGAGDDVDAYIEQVGEDTLKMAILRDAVTEYLVDECIQVEPSDDYE